MVSLVLVLGVCGVLRGVEWEWRLRTAGQVLKKKKTNAPRLSMAALACSCAAKVTKAKSLFGGMCARVTTPVYTCVFWCVLVGGLWLMYARTRLTTKPKPHCNQPDQTPPTRTHAP